jgi:hypothetical protein
MSEYQIQHILNDVGELLKNQKPKNLKRLGIDEISGSSLPFMLNQQTRCQDNILLTQKFRKFLKP